MPPPRVALLGTFDVDNYGDHLFPRVAAHELGRRLPGVVVDAFSPYGWRHPTPLDDGWRAAPLGPWSPARARHLAGANHLVVIGGGELIHLQDGILAPVYEATVDELRRMAPSRWFVEALGPRLEIDCPVVWHGVGVPWVMGDAEAERIRVALADRPYVTVRDRHSAERLVKAGVDRPVEVVPDSGLLMERIMPAGSLQARLDGLRRAGGYPPPGSAVLVVQGAELVLPQLAGVAAAVAAWEGEVVIVATGRCRGDNVFADALEAAVARRVWRLPDGAAVEDLAAAIAGGDLFLGSSLHGAITALAYGRPWILLNVFDDAKLDGFADLTGLGRFVLHSAEEASAGLAAAVTAGPARPELVAALQRQVDRHFDRLAELASERAAARPVRGRSPRPNAYRRLRLKLTPR